MLKDIEKKMKKDERKRTAIVVSILVSIILIALIGITVSSLKNSFSTKMVSLKPIDVTVSSSNGNRPLSVKISLEVKNKAVEKLDMNNIMYLITDELKNVDYNEIAGINGSEKLKEIILQCLNEHYKGVEKVYLENLVTDIKSEDLPKEEKEENNKSDILKGFKWSN